MKKKGKALLSKVGVGKKDKKKDKNKKGKSNAENIDSWDDVVTFKNVENVEHTLHFKGEGADAKLYMQSTDDHVLKHLNNAEKVAHTPAEKKAVADGTAYYNNNVLTSNNELWKLEKRRTRLLDNNKDGKNEAKIKTNEDAIKKQNKVQDKALIKLAQLFKAIKFDDGVEPTTEKTRVVYKQDDMGRALEVEATPLTWIAGNTKGSEPYQNPLGWDRASSDVRDKIYVRGHLLNHNIHGPGVRWNLVPITKVMNSAMEKEAESKGKKVLEEKNSIMWYKTKVVEYYKSDSHKQDIYFPKEVKVEWGYYKNKDGQYDAKGNIADIKSATFKQGKPAMPYNINDLGEKLLIDKLELNAKFARAVNEERKENGWFKDIRHFRERMNLYYDLNRSSEKAEMKEGIKKIKEMFPNKIIF